MGKTCCSLTGVGDILVFDSAPSRSIFDSFTGIGIGDILGFLDGAVVGLRSGVRFG